MKCPKCGSENTHESQLHECPQGGTPMKCDSCYHTWCQVEKLEGDIWLTEEDREKHEEWMKHAYKEK